MTEKIYLTTRKIIRRYNPNFGDDRLCECGRTYRQHFRRVCGTVHAIESFGIGPAIPAISLRPPGNLIHDDSRSCKKFREPKRLLTGKELKFAAEHKLQVRYVEQYHNPMDAHMNYNRVTVMEPANVGYYIGNSDIDPSCYTDDERIEGDFPEGIFAVYKVPGVVYNDRFKRDDIVVITHEQEDLNGQLGLIQEVRDDSRGLSLEVKTETDDGNRTWRLLLPVSRCEKLGNLEDE